MYNTYFSSTIVSLGSRGSLSSSSSDCPYLLNDRFQRNPLLGSSSSSSDCCCSCCSCCGSCTHRVPTNPSYLYGLRQSNLIQWSCSRRLFLGGGRRYFCRVPVNGIELDGGGYEVSCSVKKRSGGRGIGRRSGRVRVLEDESESYGLGGVEDVEAVISLLCEEIGKEGFGGRERRRRGSVARVEVETRGNNGGESYIRRKKSVGSSSLESDSKFKIESVNGESREEGYSYRQGKERTALSRGERRQKNVGVTSLESDSKCRFESVNAASREEDYRQHREREALSKDESRRTRKEGSVSSYYSFSSSGDFESDVEAEAKHGELMEESSSGFQEELRKNKDSKFREEVKEERRVDDSEEHREESRWKNTTVGRSGVEWDWRKNSEKKLAQVSIEEDQSRKESSQMHSRVTRIKESDYGKAYSSQKQFDSEEENLTFVGSSKKGTNEQYSKSESRMKHQELTDRQGIHNSSVDKFSRSQNQVSGREEKGNAMMRTGEHLKAVGVIAGKYDSRTNSQQLTGLPERHSVTERTSNLRRESETRMKNWEETSTSVQISDRETEERQRLIGERTTGQVDLRKESQQGFSMISETSDSKSKKTSILQSDSRLKSQVQNSRVASSSGLEAEEKHSRTDQGVIRRIQSQKGSQDVTSTSMVHAGDMVTVIGSGRISEKRVTDQEAHLTSTVRRERHNQTDERVMQLESTREAAKRKVSSFRENISEEASSSGASLSLVSPARPQKIDAGEENQRSSSARMMPPSAQLVSRGSFHIELASGIASGQGTTELDFEPYGGAGRDETYRNPSNFITDKDALSSAYQSQKFSQEYVSDFVEQARHEIQTSETRKEKKVSETILVHGDENRTQNSSIQDSSGDSQLKEHDSRRTSGGSGTKGPSDEMWHVTDPSIQEPSIVRDPEVTMPTDNTTENAIVRRSGRSMWNIIADIARLRWGSHTESPGSVGAKSSPNESVGTEGWFSGREHEESSDENAKKKRIKPQETTSSNEKQLGKSSSQSEGETSDTMRSKDKKRDTEAETSYPPSIVESGSAPISNSGEENLGSNEDRKSFPGTSSGMAIVESSLPLIARGSRRSPIIEEISETGKTDVSRHGSLELIEQPSNTRLTEGKDGELKRRKLKRENQLVRDCYDDWEDAYKHESEQQKIDEMFMREALAESKKAADAWEVPVGAVLVQNGTIIARGYNLVEELRDSTAHAEMICIREASNQLKTWRLADTTLYVTLEPCPMCAGAILQARIDTLVWGAPNKLLGADGSWVRLFPNGGSPSSSESGDKPSGPVHPFHPNMKIRRGVLSGECADAMQQFFQLRRKKKKGTESDLPNPSSTLAVRRHPSKFLSRMQQIFHVMFCL